ncbi:hypothetical protein D3C72_1714000 [compost metagenome]
MSWTSRTSRTYRARITPEGTWVCTPIRATSLASCACARLYQAGPAALSAPLHCTTNSLRSIRMCFAPCTAASSIAARIWTGSLDPGACSAKHECRCSHAAAMPRRRSHAISCQAMRKALLRVAMPNLRRKSVMPLPASNVLPNRRSFIST